MKVPCLTATGVAFVLLLAAGCSPATPQQRLAGKWEGAPNVSEAVSEVVNTAAQGKKVNKLAEGAANFFGNLVAGATMSVELDLRDSGTAFYRGNTKALGFPADSDGTWEVVSANPDILEIRLKTGDVQLPGKVVFRNKDEFTLKFESKVKDEKTGEEKAVTTAIVFKRQDS